MPCSIRLRAPTLCLLLNAGGRGVRKPRGGEKDDSFRAESAESSSSDDGDEGKVEAEEEQEDPPSEEEEEEEGAADGGSTKHKIRMSRRRVSDARAQARRHVEPGYPRKAQAVQVDEEANVMAPKTGNARQEALARVLSRLIASSSRCAGSRHPPGTRRAMRTRPTHLVRRELDAAEYHRRRDLVSCRCLSWSAACAAPAPAEGQGSSPWADDRHCYLAVGLQSGHVALLRKESSAPAGKLQLLGLLRPPWASAGVWVSRLKWVMVPADCHPCCLARGSDQLLLFVAGSDGSLHCLGATAGQLGALQPLVEQDEGPMREWGQGAVPFGRFPGPSSRSPPPPCSSGPLPCPGARVCTAQ